MLFSFQVVWWLAYYNSAIDYSFDCTMVREHNWHDFNSFKCVNIVLWPRIWSTLVDVPWAFEKKVYSVVLVEMFYKCQTDPVRSSIILLIFCLVILSMVGREILKFSTIIVGLSTFPFSSISFYFTYFQFFCLGHTHVELIYLLDTLIN